MPFEFKPITRVIDLAQYDAAYEGAKFEVWVNLPRSKLAEWYAIKQETLSQITLAQSDPTTDDKVLEARGQRWIELSNKLCEWYAEVWSKGAETWEPERVNELMEHLLDTDPQAWAWLITQTQQAITDHREGHRKN